MKKANKSKAKDRRDIEREMERIADKIFSYNPKTDPRDPLYKTLYKKNDER